LKKSRNTRQRAVILDILRNTANHPTAEIIYLEARKVLPNISLGTVYRNLNFLREQGLVREIRSNSDSSSRFEGTVSPHAHFHCRNCQSVHDVPLPECIAGLDWSAAGPIFKVSSLELHLIGACTQCATPAMAPVPGTPVTGTPVPT
jgi:Fur family peroxide stress response transcriptional regulator